MTHLRQRLDDRIHSPVRFSVLSLLCAVDEAEFRAVRDAVEISDSTLSQAVAVLGEAGFVIVRKQRFGRSTRSWLSATEDGRAALRAHASVLSAIAEGRR
jgi:DNA-binding MarR family transcriptional regulator